MTLRLPFARRTLVASALLLGAVLASGRRAEAQASATGTMNVSATVLTPIQLNVTSGLVFGRVAANVAKTIGPDVTGSGRFNVQGEPAIDFTLTLTLPSTLANGANTMPIASWSLAAVDGVDAAGGATSAPASGTGVTFVLPAGGRKSFRLGATVSPAAAQASGAYAGTSTVSVTYNGM